MFLPEGGCHLLCTRREVEREGKGRWMRRRGGGRRGGRGYQPLTEHSTNAYCRLNQKWELILYVVIFSRGSYDAHKQCTQYSTDSMATVVCLVPRLPPQCGAWERGCNWSVSILTVTERSLHAYRIWWAGLSVLSVVVRGTKRLMSHQAPTTHITIIVMFFLLISFTGQSNTYQDRAFHSSHSVQDTWESIPHIKQVHCLWDKSTVEQIFKLCACTFMQQVQRVCDLSCDCLCFYGNNFSNSCIHRLPRYSVWVTASQVSDWIPQKQEDYSYLRGFLRKIQIYMATNGYKSAIAIATRSNGYCHDK